VHNLAHTAARAAEQVAVVVVLEIADAGNAGHAIRAHAAGARRRIRIVSAAHAGLVANAAVRMVVDGLDVAADGARLQAVQFIVIERLDEAVTVPLLIAAADVAQLVVAVALLQAARSIGRQQRGASEAGARRRIGVGLGQAVAQHGRGHAARRVLLQDIPQHQAPAPYAAQETVVVVVQREFFLHASRTAVVATPSERQLAAPIQQYGRKAEFPYTESAHL